MNGRTDKTGVTVRIAVPDDAASLLAIYAPYVENTAVSFELTPPSEDEFRDRIVNTLRRYPYIVAVENGEAVGYAYAHALYTRAAYDCSVEISLYVKQDKRHTGIGRALFTSLELLCAKQNILNLYACIAAGEPDEHLSNDSERFHKKMGFVRSAYFTKCGFKFGRWYDVVWMEKLIGTHTDTPEPFIPFPDIGQKIAI